MQGKSKPQIVTFYEQPGTMFALILSVKPCIRVVKLRNFVNQAFHSEVYPWHFGKELKKKKLQLIVS